MNSDQSFMLEQTGSAQRKALGVGIVCLALCLIELVIHPTQFLRSYLFGEVFWLGIGLSCMGILMLHHLVSGRWGFVLTASGSGCQNALLDGRFLYPGHYWHASSLHLVSAGGSGSRSYHSAEDVLPEYAFFHCAADRLLGALDSAGLLSEPLVDAAGWWLRS